MCVRENYNLISSRKEESRGKDILHHQKVDQTKVYHSQWTDTFKRAMEATYSFEK
jgi:hypothetical protein